MAMIKCSECKKSISDKASSCPKCGNTKIKKNQEKKTFANNPLLIIPIVLLIGIIIFTIVSCSSRIKNIRDYNRDIQETMEHTSNVHEEITDYIINSIE